MMLCSIPNRFLFSSSFGNNGEGYGVRIGDSLYEPGSYTSENEWHNIILERNELDEFRFYIDGVLSPNIITITQDIDTHDTWIGGFYQSENNQGYFNGFLDDISIWNRILNSDEKDQLIIDGMIDNSDGLG